jgi:anaerobic magnesium-protoporphyrin IX monomethyl ester cyclase
MKAILINPYVPLEVVYGASLKDLGAVLPPLGIFYLASYLKQQCKHAIEILDANALQMGPEAVLAHLAPHNFQCAGFTATTLAYPYAVEYARLIKQQFPTMTIIIGGSHAQSDPDGILTEYPGLFDFVCYGEGEFAYEALLDYLEHHDKKADLIGWKYLENGMVVTTSPAPIPDNLDVFGHPADVLPKAWVPLYHEKINAYKDLPMFAVMSSRGCPFQCTFCSTPRKFTHLYHKHIKCHSVAWIIQELTLLEKNYGIREVIFVDDTFNLNRDRVVEFCNAKRQQNLQIIWSCNFGAKIADKDLLKQMKHADCWAIMVGAESGADEVLKFIKKGVTTEQFHALGKWANEEGIVSRVSFIFGLPTDTEATINQTIEFIRQSDFHFPYFQLYIPFPGTAMFDQLATHGTMIAKDEKHKSAGEVNYLPFGLTAEFLATAPSRAYKETYLRWRMIKNHVQFIRSFKDIKRYFKGMSVFVKF